jgi:hypothetical protein
MKGFTCLMKLELSIRLQDRRANPLTGESPPRVVPEYQAPKSSFGLATVHMLTHFQRMVT